MAKPKTKNTETAANLGFEARLWAAADALRNNMDAAGYKHVILGLIFLKYISDAFEARHAGLEAQRKQGSDPEDPDECRASSIFCVPKEARWTYLKASAPQPAIGTLVDDAMAAIEFERLARPLYERIVACAREAHNLSALRDTLLTKPNSGELRLKDAERRIANVQ